MRPGTACLLACACACGPQSSLSTSAKPTIVPGTLNAMTLSGTVTDATQAPVAGVQLRFDYLTSTSPGGSYSQATTVTDAAGAYAISFDAIPDAINGGLAFASATGTGYEVDYRYVRVDTTEATYGFSIRPVEMLPVGSSMAITLRPDDPVCVNNVQDQHPWPFDEEWVCHTVRVIAPADGTLTIEMIPSGTSVAATQLEVETAGGELRFFAPTTSIPVVAGEEVLVNPELRWGASANQEITVAASFESSDPPNPPNPPNPPSDPIVPGVVKHIVLSGTVTAPGNVPLAGAYLYFDYLDSTAPGAYYKHADAFTDANGRYTITIDAIPDAMNGGLAFAWGHLDGYEYDYRYVKVPTQQASFDFHFVPIVTITAGQSITVTLHPGDKVCSNNVQDMHPWPFTEEWTCPTIRVHIPTSGTLTVQMVPVGASPTATQLVVEASGGLGFFAPTQSLPVSGGETALVYPEMHWGAAGDQTVTIYTSM